MKRLISAGLAASMLMVGVSAFAAEVDRREVRQQDRISQGVRSGSLTPRETAHIEHRESRIRREVRRDRAENGGRLTPGERARVNRQENRTSRQINADEHNGRHI